MIGSYKILSRNNDPNQQLKGVALPIFIHNGGYFFTSLYVYEDGICSCWEHVPLDDLHMKISSGWLDTQAPVGATIGIHDLASLTVADTKWELSKDQIVGIARQELTQLNRKSVDLFGNLQQPEKEETEEPNLQVTAKRGLTPKIYRVADDGTHIEGARIPILEVVNEDIVLRSCFVYQDGQAQVESTGELFPYENIMSLFDAGKLTPKAENGSWITILGLGRFQIASGYWFMDQEDFWTDIQDKYNVLNGQINVVQKCSQAFQLYKSDASEENHAVLREAYEAVPKHHRIYTQQDRDSKDFDIKRILYGNNR